MVFGRERVNKYTGVDGDSMSHGLAMATDPFGQPISGKFTNNTPFGYLTRMAWQNRLFPDDVRIHEITQDGKFHISQPVYRPQHDVPGVDPENFLTPGDIEEWMEENGWRIVIAAPEKQTFFQTESGIEETGPHHHIWFNENHAVFATDTKPKNFARRTDRELIPFDLVLYPTRPFPF